MAKSIIPKFQLNLDIPEYDSFGDSSFSANTEQFLNGTTAQQNVMAKGYGDYSKMPDLKAFGLDLDPAAGNEVNGTATFGTNIGAFGQHIGEKLGEGASWMAGSIISLPDNVFRAVGNIMGLAVNPIMKALGAQAIDFDKTLTQATTDVAKVAGNAVGVTAGIDTSKWEDTELKRVVDDAQAGRNVLAEMEKRAEAGFTASAENTLTNLRSDSEGWGKAAEFAGNIAYSVPVMVAAGLTGGIASTAGYVSSGLGDAMDNVEATGGNMTKAIAKGMYQGAIDSYTELIFGLFGEAAALVNGSFKSLSKLGLKAIGDKIGSKTVGKVIMTLFGLAGTAGEEGLEEAIAYPFYQYVDWAYKPENEGKGWAEFRDSGSISGNDWVKVAAVGAASGALFGMFSMPGTIKSEVDAAKAKRIGDLGQQVIAMDINDPNMVKVSADFVQEVAQVINTDRRKMGDYQINPVYLRKGHTFNVDNTSGPAVLNTTPVQPMPSLVDLQVEPSKGKRTSTSIANDKVTAATISAMNQEEGDLVEPKGIAGKMGKAITEAGTEVDFEYRAVNANDLIGSMDVNGNANPAYDQSLQPRDTDRPASILKMKDIAKNFDPERLGENRMVTDGAIMTGEDLQVEAGNHRTAVLQNEYSKKNSKNAKAYKQWLIQNADKYGLGVNNLPDNPVLIRVRKTAVDRANFAAESNAPSVQQMSSTERATGDARLITDEMLAYFAPTEDGEINNAGNREFIRRFVNEVIPLNERGASTDANGDLSTDGLTRVRNALFFRAYGDTRLLALIAESTDNHIKNMTNSLVAVAPKVIKVKKGIADGVLYDLDFATDIAAAAEQFAQMKKSKTNVYIFATQQELGESDAKIRAKKMLLSIHTLKSAKKLTAFFTDLLDVVELAGNPSEITMFGTLGAPSKSEVIEAALRRNQVEKAAELQAKGADGEYTLDQIGQAAPEPKTEAVRKESKQTVAQPATVPDAPQTPLTEGEHKKVKGYVLALPAKPTASQKAILTNNGFSRMGVGDDNRWFAPKNRFHQAEFDEAMIAFNSDAVKQVTQAITDDADPWATPDSEMDPLYVENVVAPGFVPQGATAPANATGYVGERNADVQKRIDEAAFAVRDRQTLWQLVKSALHEFSLGETQIEYDNGDVRESIVDLQKVNGRASMLIKLHLDRAYSNLSDAEYELAKKTAFYADLAYDVSKGMWHNKKLPFDIPDEAYVLQAYADTKAAMALPANAKVVKALDLRKKLFQNLRNTLVKNASKINMDLALLYSKPDYFAHVIHEYIDQGNAGNGKVKYKKRKGSELDYVTDLEMNDLFVAKKLLRDTAYVDALLKLKKLDQKKRMTNSKGVLNVAPGYVLVHTSELGVDYHSTAEIAKNMSKVDADIKKRRAKIDSDYAQAQNQANSNAELLAATKDYQTRMAWLGKFEVKAMNRAQMDAAGEAWVIPSDIAKAVKSEFEQARQADAEAKIMRKMTGLWKQIVTHAPNKIIKYAMRNALGDAEAIFLAEPKAFLMLNEAFRDLVQLNKAGQASARMVQYIKNNGMTTGLSLSDMEGIKSFERLRFSRPKGGKGAVIDAVTATTRKYFKSAQAFTEFREQLFRYATYLHYDNMITNDIKNGGKGLPIFYGAAVPAEIKTITDPHRRAFVLSNKLVGDYNNISRQGQQISKTLWPFYRFFEMNMRRNFRILMNVFYSDPDVVLTQGQQVAARHAKGMKLGKMAILNMGRLAITYGILKGLEELWNNVLFAETERNLPEDIRNRSHMNMGMVGGKAQYLGGISVIEQFWQSLGMTSDIPMLGDAYDIASGKVTFMGKVRSIATNTSASYINGLSPFVKLPIELATGTSIYTVDGSDPRVIRDKWKYVADQVGLGDLYNAVAGRPQPGGSPLGALSNFGSSSVFKGEGALWDVYSMKDDYLKSIGKEGWSGGVGDAKAQAFYYYKMSLKLGDNDAAERYLSEYMMHGGTAKTLRDSLDNLDPLASLTKRERSDMLRQMEEADKARYAEALDYVNFLKSENSKIVAGK